VIFAVAILAASAPAAAQDEDRHTYQDATGFVWGVASFEALTVGGILVANAAGCDEDCAGFVVLGSMIAAAGLGIGAGLGDWPADVPFVTLSSVLTLAIGAGAGYGLGIETGMQPDHARMLAILMGVGLGIAGGVYTTLRRDDYVRDPNVAGAAHLMTWGTMAGLSLTGLIGAFAAMEDATLSLVMSAVGAAIFGVAVGLGEAHRG
jgi:hypothetical protein